MSGRYAELQSLICLKAEAPSLVSRPYLPRFDRHQLYACLDPSLAVREAAARLTALRRSCAQEDGSMTWAKATPWLDASACMTGQWLHAGSDALSSDASQTRAPPVAGHYVPIRPAWGFEGVINQAGVLPEAVLVQQLHPGLGNAGRPGRVSGLQKAASIRVVRVVGPHTTCQGPSSVARLGT